MSYRTIEQVQSVVVKFVTQKTLEEITAQLKRLVPESKTYWPNTDSCRVGDWIKKLEYSFKQIESVVMPHVDPKYHTSIIQQLIWLDGSFLKAEDQTKVQADLEQLKKQWREAETKAQAEAQTDAYLRKRLDDQAALDALKKKREAKADAQVQAQIKASGPIKTKSDIIEELEKSRSKMTAEYEKLGKKVKKLEIKIKIAKLKKELESFEDSDSDEEILTCKPCGLKGESAGPKVRLPNLMSDYSDSESEPEIDSDDE